MKQEYMYVYCTVVCGNSSTFLMATCCVHAHMYNEAFTSGLTIRGSAQRVMSLAWFTYAKNRGSQIMDKKIISFSQITKKQQASKILFSITCPHTKKSEDMFDHCSYTLNLSS